jgi:hypothetical protein
MWLGRAGIHFLSDFNRVVAFGNVMPNLMAILRMPSWCDRFDQLFLPETSTPLQFPQSDTGLLMTIGASSFLFAFGFFGLSLRQQLRAPIPPVHHNERKPRNR